MMLALGVSFCLAIEVCLIGSTESESNCGYQGNRKDTAKGSNW